MTAISLPDAKKPSHVAQELTPCPINACSLGRFSQRADAPEAMISVRVWMGVFACAEVQLIRVLAQVDGDEVGHLQLCAKAHGLLLHVLDQVGSLDALRPAGKVLHQRGDRELAAGLVAFEDERLQVGAGGVNSSGKAGAAGAQDDGVVRGDLGHGDDLIVTGRIRFAAGFSPCRRRDSGGIRSGSKHRASGGTQR